MREIFKNAKFRFLFFIAVFVTIVEVLGIFHIHGPQFLEIPFLLGVILIVGRKVLWGGVQSIFSLKITNIYFLMTIAIIGAALLGQLEEAAVIVALFAVSEQLEDLGIEQSQEAIESLVKKTPKQVTLQNGELKAVDAIDIDEVFIVKPGEVIGLDGIVVDGVSSIDEAAITGEPLPVEKSASQLVFAGTVNQYGTLKIKVTKKASQSTLKRIVELTQSAIQNKASYQQFIEKFSTYYTPIVFFLALGTVIIPTLFGQDVRFWFERAITLLVIACPCALVVSTPISIFSAIGNASKKGALIKGGRFLEELGQVKAIAFDKTRTLTYGKPVIEKVMTYHQASSEEVLACAAGMETHSEHPLAQAVVQYAKEKNLELHSVEDFKAIVGKGIQAECLVCKVGNHQLGNLDFIAEKHSQIPQEVKEQIAAVQKKGQTPLLLADDEGIKGLLVVSDEIKPEAKQLITTLKKLGIYSMIVTGDHQQAADRVAQELGIDAAKGDLLPEGKVNEVKALKDRFGKVAMIGDGVNDAPVLSMANVGIAMGAAGSDVAIASADIALMSDNIALLPFLIRLGRRTKHTIQMNIGLALVTKVVAVLLSILGILPLTLAVFADVGVTFVVILLSLQLLNFQNS